eukprot:GHVT01019639.1.p1 GENE.GHVT01019639.1~~GHVT01019639.1.p1  ORF type:complete len:160 (+),score=16.58 GHVT01019639.1:169-648(+)
MSFQKFSHVSSSQLPLQPTESEPSGDATTPPRVKRHQLDSSFLSSALLGVIVACAMAGLIFKCGQKSAKDIGAASKNLPTAQVVQDPFHAVPIECFDAHTSPTLLLRSSHIVDLNSAVWEKGKRCPFASPPRAKSAQKYNCPHNAKDPVLVKIFNYPCC